MVAPVAVGSVAGGAVLRAATPPEELVGDRRQFWSQRRGHPSSSPAEVVAAAPQVSIQRMQAGMVVMAAPAGAEVEAVLQGGMHGASSTTVDLALAAMVGGQVALRRCIPHLVARRLVTTPQAERAGPVATETGAEAVGMAGVAVRARLALLRIVVVLVRQAVQGRRQGPGSEAQAALHLPLDLPLLLVVQARTAAPSGAEIRTAGLTM